MSAIWYSIGRDRENHLSTSTNIRSLLFAKPEEGLYIFEHNQSDVNTVFIGSQNLWIPILHNFIQ